MANKAMYAIQNGVGRDKAVTLITVTIDPALWSGRKKNIIVRAIQGGIASCGRETIRLVQAMVGTYCGDELPAVSSWRGSVALKYVKPDKREELTAYTAAWVRLKAANHKPRPQRQHRYYGVDDGLTWGERHFLDDLGKYGQQDIPLPSNLSHKGRGEFISTYLIEPSAEQTTRRKALLGKIINNEPLTFSFDN